MRTKGFCIGFCIKKKIVIGGIIVIIYKTQLFILLANIVNITFISFYNSAVVMKVSLF